MQVAIITEEQKNSLIGVLIAPYTYFNLDLRDASNNICIDSESINLCNIEWLKELPLVNFNAPSLPTL